MQKSTLYLAVSLLAINIFLSSLHVVFAAAEPAHDLGKPCNLYQLRKREKFSSVTNFYRSKLLQQQLEQSAATKSVNFAQAERFPIVLIPGIGGSGLEAQVDEENDLDDICKENSYFPTAQSFRLWITAGLATGDTYYKMCWAELMALNYQDGQFTSKKGIHTTVVPGLNSIAYLAKLGRHDVYGYFGSLIAYLKSELGYTPGVDLFAAPYDWRKTGNDTEWLEKIVRHAHKTAGKKVVLVAHSMGNLWTNLMLSQKTTKWLRTYIKGYASVAAPWLGATKSIRSLISGDTIVHNWFVANVLNLFPSLTMRELLKDFGSSYWLMPHPQAWNSYPFVKFIDTDYESEVKGADLPGIGRGLGWNMELMRDVWGSAVSTPPRVNTWCSFGNGVPTERHYVYNNFNYFEDPDVFCGDGDGTVNIESLNHCDSFVGNNNNKPVKKTTYSGVDHNGILNDKEFMEDLAKYLEALKQP